MSRMSGAGRSDDSVPKLKDLKTVPGGLQRADVGDGLTTEDEVINNLAGLFKEQVKGGRGVIGRSFVLPEEPFEIIAEIVRASENRRRSVPAQVNRIGFKTQLRKLATAPGEHPKPLFANAELLVKEKVGGVFNIAGVAEKGGEAERFYRAIGSDPRLSGPHELNSWLLAAAVYYPTNPLSEGIMFNRSLLTKRSVVQIGLLLEDSSCGWKKTELASRFRERILRLNPEEQEAVQALKLSLAEKASKTK